MVRLDIGYETVEKYAEYTGKRLSEPLHLRPMQIVARFFVSTQEKVIGAGPGQKQDE